MTCRGRPLIPPLAFVCSTTRSVETRIRAPSMAPTPVMSSRTPTLIGLPVGGAAAAGAAAGELAGDAAGAPAAAGAAAAGAAAGAGAALWAGAGAPLGALLGGAAGVQAASPQAHTTMNTAPICSRRPRRDGDAKPILLLLLP